MLSLLPLILQAASPTVAPASSPAVVTSDGPENVLVTVYRNPDRAIGDPLDLQWLQGRALITETRTVDLPAGPAEIRFEGVANGIVPVSALVTGLPGGTVEKNRDAHLLSPTSLVDGNLGRYVHIRRTDRASGKVQEEDARIVAGPAGGVVLQTASGVVALGCSGLAEQSLYPGLPDRLSARPTLSVTTISPQASRATISLSYLADDFDWEARYIARIAPDGRTLDLFAWLTLANGNAISFRGAQTMAVAGTLSEDEEAAHGRIDSSEPELSLSCWPMGTTSDVPLIMPPPPAPIALMAPPAPGADIVVTARKRQETLQDVPLAVLVAEQENLGDLKLYRIPEPVTVAAASQKQVALLLRRDIRYATVYSFLVRPGDAEEGGDSKTKEAEIILRLQNRQKDGLGLPLPAGRIAVMATRGDRDLMVGEGIVDDVAIGQEANLSIGRTVQVQGALTALGERHWRYAVSNANPFPVAVEAVIALGSGRLRGDGARLERRNGLPLWKVEVPANGTRHVDLPIGRAQD